MINLIFLQAGLAPRNCFEVLGIDLSAHAEKTSFTTDVERRKLGNLGTYTDLQLSFLSEVGFSPARGGRREAAKIAVLIVDNHSADLEVRLILR